MSVFKRPESPYWQIEFQLAGVTVKRSSKSRKKQAAIDMEDELRSDLRKQLKEGPRYTWAEALKKCEAEDAHQKSWKRTQFALAVIAEYIQPTDWLDEITYGSLLAIRGLLELRERKGHGWKNTHRTWTKNSCNRVLAVISSILVRCASKKWEKMISEAPEIPLFTIEKKTPKWVTRSQAHMLLGRFPEHTRDMMMFACATGLRKTNVTRLEWDRIDLARKCCHIDGYQTKGGDPIPVPLNDDAMEVLLKWQRKHAEMADEWSAEVHRYVFVYGSHAPIGEVTTKMWRRVCKEAGLAGVTFHTMRHSWASWQVQAGTPLRILQELGGWASIDMPARNYSHLDPGHLADYANRSLLGAGPPKILSLDSSPSEPGASHCSGGAEGNRTLDLCIANPSLVRKAS